MKFLSGALFNAARICGNEAKKAGFNAYLVGGGVRDIILGIKCGDIDVCFEPTRARGSIKSLFNRIAKITRAGSFKFHRDFLTAELSLKGGHRLDLSITRSEIYTMPGALPVVNPSDLRNDVLRRDFSINSLALSLNPGKFGEITDLCGGLNDIKSKKIRILHGKSFKDDPTRIFRAIRFSERLGFKIEIKTAALIRKAVRENYLRKVSRERIISELLSALTEDKPAKFLKTVSKFGISYNIFCLDSDKTAGILDGVDSPVDKKFRSAVRLALILRIYGHEKAKKILKCMKVQRKMTNEIINALKFSEKGMGGQLPEWAGSFLRISGYKKEWKGINGRDLIAMGMTPGPEFSKILSYVNSPCRFTNRKSALEYLKTSVSLRGAKRRSNLMRLPRPLKAGSQ